MFCDTAAIFSAGAAVLSAFFAGLAFLFSRKLSTRERIDILKAEILRVVSTIEGKKQWGEALMKSRSDNGHIAANIEVVVPLLCAKYKKWDTQLLSAAIAELRNEGYGKLLGHPDIKFTSRR